MLVKPLHPYQTEPVDLFLSRGSLLVAYEMGLGKTPIAIACAEQLLGCGDIDCTLIVCAASLKLQWGQKLAEFTDMPGVPMRVKNRTIIVPAGEYTVIVNGTPGQRALQYRRIHDTRPQYVVLGYENVVNDWREVRKIGPGMTVLDECTAIKSFRAQRTRKIKRLLDSEYRLGLTGTPVENKPEELFSIMEWVDSSVLGRFDLFDRAYIKRDHFGRVQEYKNLPVLRRRIRPAISRRSRLDPEVAPYMPDVEHGTWEISLPGAHWEYYRRICRDLHAALAELPAGQKFDIAAYYQGRQSEENSALGKVMARQTILEMFLDHPQLLRRSADLYKLGGNEGSKYADELVTAAPPPAGAPKLDYLQKVVADILGFDPRNKILIFSRFVGMQRRIAAAIDFPGVVLFHGGMSAAEKAAAVARFTDDESARVFVSSHAGAYGADMYMANYLINYDLPWSAGKADQINGRHVRASSKFPRVVIRDMIMAGTVEERKQQMLSIKRKVGSAILDGYGQDENGAVVNDLESLMSHLLDVLKLS